MNKRYSIKTGKDKRIKELLKTWYEDKDFHDFYVERDKSDDNPIGFGILTVCGILHRTLERGWYEESTKPFFNQLREYWLEYKK